MGKPKFCPRCGKKGVRVSSDTHEIWNCPDQHGVIWKEALPEPAPAPEPAAETFPAAEETNPQAPPPETPQPRPLN